MESNVLVTLLAIVYPMNMNVKIDIFAVCSLVPSMNLSHSQQSYLCPKNQNYLLEKANLRFFLNYGFRTAIKITILGTFYVTDNFQTVVVKIHAKRCRLFQ